MDPGDDERQRDRFSIFGRKDVKSNPQKPGVLNFVTILGTIELGAGILIALIALRDVFDTVVVPGGSGGGLRIARRLVALLRPARLRLRRHGRGIPTSFGPLIILFTFVMWMGLLALAFGMMAHALHRSFDPPLFDFWQAVYLAGSALVTIGLSETDALGGARWVVLAAGFCGLAVMTMTVTYLLELQMSIADRDKGVFKLQTAAGDPSSGVALLEKYAAIGAVDDLTEVLTAGRDWCASVRQSHIAHPALIYFHTKGTGAGWPATLGALLDLALIVEFCLDRSDLRGRATMLREDGTRLAADITSLLRLDSDRDLPSGQDLEAVRTRLAAAGYSLSSHEGSAGFAEHYRRCAGAIAALAHHLGEEPAPLAPKAQGHTVWSGSEECE